MEVSFSQSFLTDLERIDNKIVITDCVLDSETSYHPEVVCHENVMQVCIVDVGKSVCNRLDFYYNDEIAFTITDSSTISLSQYRTIFVVTLPQKPKAVIECPWITEDTKFLESIGQEFGCSFYKDIKISNDSLVWKESLNKYSIDRGIQDNHLYDVELFDTKSGSLEERAIKFKSYQNITIKQGNWRVDTIKRTSVEKHDAYSEISDSSFLVWDSPMIDSKVDLSITPNCIDNIGKYVDPGEVIYGNTDCFQYTKYQSSLRGFRITGTEGTRFEVLFNRESIRGNYTSYSGIIGEEGKVEIRIPEDLPYYHFNGIVAIGPSRVTSLETIMYLEEVIEEYVPNPDKTYVVDLNNTKVNIDVEGVCEYIEYEKYLGKITEIGRGEESIRSVPGLSIDLVKTGGLNASIDSQCKQIVVNQTTRTGSEVYYNTYQVSISNNIEVNGNTMSTSQLLSDYKIRIEQVGTAWKIQNSPNYINNSDQIGIYLLGYEAGLNRVLKLMTNDRNAISRITPEVILETQTRDLFTFYVSTGSYSYIDGEKWMVYSLTIRTKSRNDENSWRPQNESGDPYLVRIRYNNIEIPSLSFYLIQLKKIENDIEVWEETLSPGKFSYADSITILNSLVKSIIVTKKSSDSALNWYYHDINNTNRFYITNLSSMVTNTGPEYLIDNYTKLLDLGTGEDREIYSRVINVNRSDQIGSLGVLTITESSSYPESWRDLIDNNTINIEVSRELDNIYIQVGIFPGLMKNEDLEVSVSRIGLFSLYVRSNFKFVVQTFGNLKIYYNSETLLDQQYIFNGYSTNNQFKIALLKLDEESSIDDSYIEIRSGSLVRKVTLKVEGPEKYHDYCTEGVEKPNLIRIFENGSFVPGISNNFVYSSTTTPKFTFIGLSETNVTTTPSFDSSTNSGYSHHTSTIPISIPNYRSLSFSKYPIESFGSLQESSLSYSSGEIIDTEGTTGPLEYLFYMKGKKHYLWCVDSIDRGFSNISDPVSSSTIRNLFLEANGETGTMLYVVSRYSVENRTFITNRPETNEIRLSLNDLEALIEISPQQKIALDQSTQIEYAIPIKVSCNVVNNNGNVFLGSVAYGAETVVTDDSIGDIIVVPDNIISKEGIDGNYIRSHIVGNSEYNLRINIYQKGTLTDVLEQYYCDIPNYIGIEKRTMYFIPQVGTDITISSVTTSKSYTGDGADLCTVSSEYGFRYFLVTVETEERVKDSDNHWFPYDPMHPISDHDSIIGNTNYEVGIHVDYNIPERQPDTINPETGEIIPGEIVIVSKEKNFTVEFMRYGCNFGFYAEGYIGFGNIKSGVLDVHSVVVPAEGGRVFLHAGIFYAVDGIWETEALRVPSEYKFIGDNTPSEVYWEDGNLDDEGNLCIVIPPRIRDDLGNKEYILQVTQPHEYYPVNLYLSLSQLPFTNPPDTDQENYKLMFLKDNLNIYSSGKIEGGDDKIYFSHNLNRGIFDRVKFDWVAQDGYTIPTIPDDLTELEEDERSYDEGYVKFKFKPNGSRTFIRAKIRAIFTNNQNQEVIIGELPVMMGYYCLEAYYRNAFLWSTDASQYMETKDYVSRVSYKLLKLYKKTSETGYEYLYLNSRAPCKSELDNSEATLDYAGGRGVFYLNAYRREYYDAEPELDPEPEPGVSETEPVVSEIESEPNAETEPGEENQDRLIMDDVFHSVDLISLSPQGILESSSVSYSGIIKSNDPDALIHPEYNHGNNHVTSENFGIAPYVEFNYQVKKDYIRETIGLSESCKINLEEPDTGDIAEFYLATSAIKRGSDEKYNIEDLEFSDYSLKFDCRGGYKQVTFSPAFFSRNKITLIGSEAFTSWVQAKYVTGSNFISFLAKENITTSINQAYYRTAQARVEVFDPRDSNSEPDPIKTFYINLEQEPDIAQTANNNQVMINVSIVNEENSEISITGEFKFYVKKVINSETRTAGIWINLPGANSQTNIITIGARSTINQRALLCFGDDVNPRDFLSGTIQDINTEAYRYDESYNVSYPMLVTMGSPSSSPGQLIFEEGESYEIYLRYSPYTPPNN